MNAKSETVWLYTPLHAVIERQWKAGVDILLEYGANVNAKAVEVSAYHTTDKIITCINHIRYIQ